MSSHRRRIKQLERNMPTTEPIFFGWIGNPWTPEQMAEAIRRSPDKLRFGRTLLETPEETARKMADPTIEL